MPRHRLQKAEDADAIEVGRYYFVQTVAVNMWGVKKVPLLGPAHSDKEIIGFPEEHWHIDWRFAQPALLEYDDIVFFGKVLSVRNAIGQVSYRRWKCVREIPDFPLAVRWLPKLEAVYAHKKLTNFICPHRGICVKNATLPQRSQPLDKLVVCPGHGLRWNTETGDMAPRCGPAQAALMKNG